MDRGRSDPRRLTRRQVLAAGGAAALLLRSRRDADAAGAGATLRIARGGDARSLDPHVNARLYDRIVLYTLYEPLLDADSSGNFFPVLAKSWEIGSTGLVVTFHLRPGVVFHSTRRRCASTSRGRTRRCCRN